MTIADKVLETEEKFDDITQQVKKKFPEVVVIVGSVKGTVQRYICLAENTINRSLLKREPLRFSADFVHLLTSERLFKFQRHLIEDYRYDELISNYCINLW
jgi:hypothetical protein